MLHEAPDPGEGPAGPDPAHDGVEPDVGLSGKEKVCATDAFSRIAYILHTS
jgi:hypothetical protein